MEMKKALPGTKVFRDVKELYFSAFPAEERLPFSRMVLLSMLKPAVALLGYYEGDTFCGFSFTVCTERYLYINFVAVNPFLRSKGYGAGIVTMLKEKYRKPVLCEVKIPEVGCESNEQDARRIAFWERNGFDFLGNEYTITNPCGVSYVICATEGPFERDAYWAIFDRMSFGPKAGLRNLKRKLEK